MLLFEADANADAMCTSLLELFILQIDWHDHAIHACQRSQQNAMILQVQYLQLYDSEVHIALSIAGRLREDMPASGRCFSDTSNRSFLSNRRCKQAAAILIAVETCSATA